MCTHWCLAAGVEVAAPERPTLAEFGNCSLSLSRRASAHVCGERGKTDNASR